MKFLLITKLSLFALVAFVSIHASAESAKDLQINPKLDSCKRNIVDTFSSLREFSKHTGEPEMAAVAKYASKESDKEKGREIMRRMETWRDMIKLGNDQTLYYERINLFKSCDEVNEFFDVLEIAVD